MTSLSDSPSRFAAIWKKISGDWHLLQDTPLSAVEIRQVFSQTSLPIFHYYILLIVATAISPLGLLTNSAATIIGGMLIAPLMSPIMTMGYSVISFERLLVRRSIFAVVTGVILVVTISFLLTTLLDLRLADSEILSRTHPNLLDLGVAIAAGGAGAFAYARPKVANAVPGVAIAVALVPPLCVVGVALASGSVEENIIRSNGQDQNMAAGAFLLFFTNVVGIIFSAGLVFLLHGYGQLRKGAGGMAILFIVLLLVAVPLDFSLRNLYAKAAVSRSIAELKQSRADLFTGRGEVIALDIAYHHDAYHPRIDAMVPEDEIPSFQERVNVLSEALSKKLRRPVHIECVAVPANIYRTTIERGGVEPKDKKPASDCGRRGEERRGEERRSPSRNTRLRTTRRKSPRGHRPDRRFLRIGAGAKKVHLSHRKRKKDEPVAGPLRAFMDKARIVRHHHLTITD